MILDQSCAPTFAAHQTFHPRFGWIKKGFDAARIDSSVFTSEDAPLRLGVGKNMVDAIRFWCNAFGVLTKSSTTSRGKVLADVPTNFGEALIGPDGLDPYMEDPSTLWVLHWRALSAPSLLPVWWLLFNRFSGREFTQEDVMRFIQDEIDAANWTQPNPSSLLKDVDCLIRMYSMRDARGRQTIDDLLDSPFREMGLLVSASQPGAYRLVLGQKPALSSAAVAFACADYIANALVGAQTCSLTKLLTDFGSPG